MFRLGKCTTGRPALVSDSRQAFDLHTSTRPSADADLRPAPSASPTPTNRASRTRARTAPSSNAHRPLPEPPLQRPPARTLDGDRPEVSQQVHAVGEVPVA